jgi:hypothetical protein
VKTSKHCFNGIRDNYHQNLISVKLKLVSKPNRTTNSVNSEAELLYGKVDEVELNFVK